MTDTEETSEPGATDATRGGGVSGGGAPGVVTVRYWAAARAAAGTSSDDVAVDGPVSVAELRERAVALHPDGGLARVVTACSVLVGEQPLGTRDPAVVMVGPGDVVELLPPFAGG